MHVLLELLQQSPPEDRKKIGKILKPYLVADDQPVDEWVSLEKLRPLTPGPKSKNWLQYNLLDAYPETRAWSTDPHPGKGRAVKANLPKARKWLADHYESIDWNQPEP